MNRLWRLSISPLMCSNYTISQYTEQLLLGNMIIETLQSFVNKTYGTKFFWGNWLFVTWNNEEWTYVLQIVNIFTSSPHFYGNLRHASFISVLCFHFYVLCGGNRRKVAFFGLSLRAQFEFQFRAKPNHRVSGMRSVPKLPTVPKGTKVTPPSDFSVTLQK